MAARDFVRGQVCPAIPASDNLCPRNRLQPGGRCVSEKICAFCGAGAKEDDSFHCTKCGDELGCDSNFHAISVHC